MTDEYYRNLLVSAQELINTIRKIQKVSNQSTDDHIWDIIHQLDANQQGSFEVDAIIKVRIIKKILFY